MDAVETGDPQKISTTEEHKVQGTSFREEGLHERKGQKTHIQTEKSNQSSRVCFHIYYIGVHLSQGCLLSNGRRNQSHRRGWREAVLRTDPRFHPGPVLWKERCINMAATYTGQPKRSFWSRHIHHRPRGRLAQEDGVPGVCLPCPLGVLQVKKQSFPHHAYTPWEGVHLDTHWTYSYCCSQGNDRRRQLAFLYYLHRERGCTSAFESVPLIWTDESVLDKKKVLCLVFTVVYKCLYTFLQKSRLLTSRSVFFKSEEVPW